MQFLPLVRVSGIFTGTVAGRGGNFANGDFLAVKKLEASLLAVLWRAKAVIVEDTTIPPHVGVLCRICGIPIVATNCLYELEGQTIQFDGFSGEWTEDALAESATATSIVPTWCEEYGHRDWQVSVCDSQQVAALSEAEIPLTFFLRHEFLWVGTDFNPFQCVARPGAGDLAERLYQNLRPFADSMHKRHRLHFRSLDARADEFENLGPISRSDRCLRGLGLTLKYPEILEIEAHVCRRIANEFDVKVLYSFPYVRSVDELNVALGVVDEDAQELDVGCFVETPDFAHAINDRMPRQIELLIGTKDLASLFFNYARGEGTEDYINPLNNHRFKALVEHIAANARERGRRCYYFCFLEHFLKSVEALPPDVGFSVCAHEFSVLTGIPIRRLPPAAAAQA